RPLNASQPPLDGWYWKEMSMSTRSLDISQARKKTRSGPVVTIPQSSSKLDALLQHSEGDPYMHLADLNSYLDATANVESLYSDPEEWTRKAILNVAHSGKFSSDRTIREYANEIWKADACPVP